MSERIEEVAEKLRRWGEHGANNKEWDRGYNAGLKAAADELEKASPSTTDTDPSE